MAMPLSAVPPDSDPVPAGSAAVSYERASCAVCGAIENRLVVTAARFLYDRPGTARIVQCVSCGHFYQDPRPTRETIGRCYPANYGPHAAPAQNPAGPAGSDLPELNAARPWYLSRFMRAIPGLRSLYYWLEDPYYALIPPRPRAGARAFEFGCGSGRYLERLSAGGWEAEGLEPAAEPAQRCRERGLKVQTGTLESAQFTSLSFDLVAAWMVLEHLHDPGAALDQIRLLLRPGGVLVFSVPNVGCWERRCFGKYYYIFNEPSHLHHFTPHSLRRLLTDHGFPDHQVYFQQNLSNAVGSLGLWLQTACSRRRMGSRLLAFCDEPTLWGRLLLAPGAKLLSALHQTGRMTVVARVP